MALNATALYTTEAVAQQVVLKAAGEELTKFTNIFRAVGKDQYTDAAQREAALSFLESSRSSNRVCIRLRSLRRSVSPSPALAQI
jgi:hypothetical protein